MGHVFCPTCSASITCHCPPPTTMEIVARLRAVADMMGPNREGFVARKLLDDARVEIESLRKQNQSQGESIQEYRIREAAFRSGSYRLAQGFPPRTNVPVDKKPSVEDRLTKLEAHIDNINTTLKKKGWFK